MAPQDTQIFMATLVLIQHANIGIDTESDTPDMLTYHRVLLFLNACLSCNRFA